MPLYMDVHRNVQGLTADGVTEAHQKDLAVQGKHGVTYLKYWYNHLTLDGRHALVIHNDLPCVPDEPPQTACGETGWRREFKVTHSAPAQDRVLIAFALPGP
jgi:hypothetical protein